MSFQDDLAAVRRCLDDLVRTVDRLEQHYAQEGGDRPGSPAADRGDDVVGIPETPYDSTLWTDSDDEGLGVRYRRAP